MIESITVKYTMEASEGAACHGYCEFDWEGSIDIVEDGVTYGLGERDTELTGLHLTILADVEKELAEEHWQDGGKLGSFHARIGYDDVPAGDVPEFKDEQAQAVAEHLTEVLKRHFKIDDVEVEPA